ncbi:Non-ribosomal peptide synthetase modules and related protein [Hahella chejuensis KCTC 2396]|uniref:Non-ribosomal peptide synthetase modules and related protein n=1 Tax=Hahella chejuensis (strain KCTC 2396) TaxID=349521 RepID=Q2SHZ2_HAHCH|nr:non-ribosomal peptide synthetase [Hahella chejuensis]ABC29732.1 Non-ribosomal peptide synthetase modules and related protein [Hahella chejuensis KCTC 2396]
MTVTKKDIKNIYPLTPVQEGMLFHALLEPESSAYFQQTAWRLRGELDADAFEQAWRLLAQRHDLLRTLFSHQQSDQPLQIVLHQLAPSFERQDLRHIDSLRADAYCRHYRDNERRQGFDLSLGPLWRISLLRLEDDLWEVVWSHHHILLDGWSYGLLLSELLATYRSLRKGEDAEAQLNVAPAPPFSRYVRWLAAQDQAASADYWRTYMEGFTEPTEPPFRRYRPDSRPENAELSFQLSRGQTERLQNLCAQHGITLNALLQATVATLLARCCDQEDVAFGTVVSGRPADLAGVENMVGPFINTVPCRIRVDPGRSLLQLAQTLQQRHLASAPHHYYPLAKIQAAAGFAGQDQGLFNLVMAVENYPVDAMVKQATEQTDLGFAVEDVFSFEKTHYDFDLQFMPGERLQGKLIYNRSRYEPAYVESIPLIFQTIIESFCSNIEVKIAAIPLLSEASLELLRDVCEGLSWRPDSDTLIDRFLRQAQASPQRIAVSDSDAQLSYEALREAANRLARRLAEQNVSDDEPVGLCTGRSVNLAVGILGILSAGGAYLPLDIAQPEARLRQQIVDSGLRVIVADNATLAALRDIDAGAPVRILALPDAAQHLEAAPELELQRMLRPDQLAYVIYTSGSTGVPKGVAIEHRSVVNLNDALWDIAYRRYSRPINVALLANAVFDASVQQLFPVLLHGHRLLVVDQDTRQDAARLTDLFIQQRITLSDCTPTLLALWLPELARRSDELALDTLLVGGEPLPSALAQAFGEALPAVRLINVYGPTECCVDATAYTVDSKRPPPSPYVPIGQPLRNTRAWVLDRHGAPVPAGVPGEIVLAGAGVSRGYLNRPELNGEKFVFLSSPCSASGAVRFYKTGDLGRWTLDGALEFLGRMDDQVKVRGHRIELGDVESHLRSHPDVEQAAALLVSPASGSGIANAELFAYIVLKQDISADTLREFLQKRLPDYMIPSGYVTLDALPLSVSGKLDRKALASLGRGERLGVTTVFSAPQSPLETLLARLWGDILGRDQVGVNDNYFALGGDSIKAIQLASRLHREGWKMAIKDLFANPTIAALSPWVAPVAQRQDQDWAALTGPVPLTPAQSRFFRDHGENPRRFNHALLLRSEQPLSTSALQAALDGIYATHESLRLRFLRDDDNRWMQEAMPLEDSPGARLREIDLRDSKDLPSALLHHGEQLHASMDPENGRLFAAALLRHPDGDRLLLTAHHLAVDGVSWRILLDDLLQGYAQACDGQTVRLPEAPAFTHWATQLARFGGGRELQADIPYWAAQEETQSLDAADAEPCRYGDALTLTRELDAELTQALLSAANHAYNTTPEDLLITALARAMAQPDNTEVNLRLLMESHGRDLLETNLDLSRCVGWFTSLWPLSLTLPADRNLAYQIKSVKESLRRVPRKGAGYALLQEFGDAAARSALRFNLQPQISFNYLGQLDAPLADASLSFSDEPSGDCVHPDAPRPCALEISAMALGGRLRLQLCIDRARPLLDADALLTRWSGQLAHLAEHCLGCADTTVTPSDLTYSDISLDELEGIIS